MLHQESDWRPSAFLFDLDGTIINSNQPQLDALIRLLREEDRLPPATDDVLPYIGVPSEKVMAQLFPGADPEPLLARLAIYERELYEQLGIHQGVEEVLAAIHKAGAPIAVVTSQVQHELVDTRQRIDIEAWVSLWVTADDVAQPKPDPAPILLALTGLRIDPGAALMIGDTEYDVEAGQRAGTKTAAALWGTIRPGALLAKGPDYQFEQPRQILGLLES